MRPLHLCALHKYRVHFAEARNPTHSSRVTTINFVGPWTSCTWFSHLNRQNQFVSLSIPIPNALRMISGYILAISHEYKSHLLSTDVWHLSCCSPCHKASFGALQETTNDNDSAFASSAHVYNLALVTARLPAKAQSLGDKRIGFLLIQHSIIYLLYFSVSTCDADETAYLSPIISRLGNLNLTSTSRTL